LDVERNHLSFFLTVPLPHHTSTLRNTEAFGASVRFLSTNTKALGSPHEAARLWSARFVVAAGPHLPYDVGFVANPLGPLRSVAGAKRYFEIENRNILSICMTAPCH
jgi:hypothetical protein